jgi:hypothetical protein
MKCVIPENGNISQEKIDEPMWINLQINDEGIYPFTCTNGHENVLIQQEEKFELLFESAAYAMSDGHFKEAVSSIASSIERLYEFSINVIALKNKIETKNLEIAWKNVSSQSERQLGAFIFLYLLEFKECPPLPKERQTKFRNKVIHKGYFPTFEEVLDFGEETLKIMFDILIVLRRECKDAIQEYQITKIKERSEKASQISGIPSNFSLSTIIGMALSDELFARDVTLKKGLKRIEQFKKF